MSIGSAIGGIGSLVGGIMGASASSTAAGQSQQGAMMALLAQQQALSQAKGALSPYYTAGQNVLPTLQNLVTPGTAADTLKTMPGFQFQSQWGNLSATNALAAQGLGGSTGPLAKAISDYNNGLAGTYYNNSVNALQNFANMGETAGAQFAGAAVNSGNAQAQTLQNYGNAGAAGTLGSYNALNSGIQGAINQNIYGGGLYGGSSGGSSLSSIMNFMNPASSLTGL